MTIGSSVVGTNGRAAVPIDTSRLEHGATAVRFSYRTAPSKGASAPLYVQLYNSGGRHFEPVDHAPAGMTLQWQDEFDAPLSVSHWGGDAAYAATKPAYWGGSTFGEAILLPPEQGAQSLTSFGSDYLRIRAQPRGERVDPNGWDRRHVSGLLSSLKVGATGFSAQYGYFEARMLAPAGKGSWPAFWMMSTESTTRRAYSSSSEVDAVELYGHDSTASCHSLHRWTGSSDDSNVKCLWPNGFADWALSWHTYGVRILPDGVDYYIDGVRVAHFDDPSHADEPHYFMLNLSLGGGYPISLGATGDIVDLYVDYVRVYT